MPVPHIVRRRTGFFFSLPVPDWLSPHLGCNAIVRSLHTADVALAERRATAAAMFWQHQFKRLRRSVRFLKGEDVAIVARYWYRHCARMAWRRWLHTLAPGARDALRYEAKEDAIDETMASASGSAPSRTRARKAPRLTQRGEPDAGLPSVGTITDTAALLPLVREIVHEAIEEQFRKIFDPVTGFALPTTPEISERRALLPISGHEENFLAWKGELLGESAKVSYRAAFRRFRKAIGDRPFYEYTKQDARAFLKHLRTAGGAKHGKPQKARSTLKKELGHLRSFFEWAVQEDYTGANPFQGVYPPPTRKGSITGARKRDFSRAELVRIFSAPLFVGARSNHYSHERGPVLIADGRFWVPLVALMTGARLGELQQLRTSDVRCLDGIDWIFITNDPSPEDDREDRRRSLKTVNARRCIPILPALKQLGFELDQHRLFAEYDYGKYFNDRFFVKVGTKCPQVSFHSFRHCFKQMLRVSIPSDECKNRLMGHSARSVGEAYGPNLVPEEGRLFLERCRPLVDLSHIVPYMNRTRPRGSRAGIPRRRLRRKPLPEVRQRRLRTQADRRV